MNKSKMVKKICLMTLLGLSPLAFTGCVALAVGAGAGATAVISSDSRSVDTMAYDLNIETKALDIINSNKELSDYKETSISVISVNGNVLLAGQTIHRAYAQWCAQKIHNLDYVKKVYNYVQIKRPVPASVVAKDSYITSEVKSQLLLGKGIKSNHFKVYTEDGNVYILGFVTPDQAKRAVNQALKVSGIKKIYTIFDYITGEPDLRADGDNGIKVVPVQNGQKSSSRSSQQRTSTYVPPVSSQDNGGAMIVDDGSSSISLEEQGQNNFTPSSSSSNNSNFNYGDEQIMPTQNETQVNSSVPAINSSANGGAVIVEDRSYTY